MPDKIAISVEGGKVTFEDDSPKAWQHYLKIFDVLAGKTKAKTAVVHFEAPDIARGLLDAVPKEELEKKLKAAIIDGSATVSVKVAREVVETAKGFDIAVRIEPIELIFFHTGKLEILADMQIAVAAAIVDILRKMFRNARVKT